MASWHHGIEGRRTHLALGGRPRGIRSEPPCPERAVLAELHEQTDPPRNRSRITSTPQSRTDGVVLGFHSWLSFLGRDRSIARSGKDEKTPGLRGADREQTAHTIQPVSPEPDREKMSELCRDCAISTRRTSGHYQLPYSLLQHRSRI